MNKLLIKNSISDNIYETPEKYLLCVGVPLARVGNYQYTIGEDLVDTNGIPLPTNPDGTIDVYKDEKVLFNPNTMASFEGKPVTIGHTMIDSNNWREQAIGIAQNVRRGTDNNSDKLIADLLITDKNGIDVIRGNVMREISLGYEAGYVSDGAGKAHQISITGNHIAIVPAGKAGHECRIFDSKIVNNGEKLMTLAEKIKKMLCSTVDEAVANDASLNNPAGSNDPADKGDGGNNPDAVGEKNKGDDARKDKETVNKSILDQDPAGIAAGFEMLNAKLDKLIELLSSNVVVDQNNSGNNPPQDKEKELPYNDDTMVNLDADKPILVE